MQYLHTLLPFLFSLLCCGLSAQTVSFNITLWGDSIGRMDVRHSTDKDSNDVYVMESKSRVKFLWIVREGLSKFEAVYKRGKLLSSSHLEMENGKTKRWAKVKFENGKYVVTSAEQEPRSFTEAPSLSDANIYFLDFKNLQRIFYLPDGNFYDLKKVDATTLEFKSADKHRNVYHFENGRIKTMEFHLPLASVYMNRLR